MTTTSTPESRARLAFTAYAKAVDFIDDDGRPLPLYDDLPEKRRHAWQASTGIIWDLATTGRATL